MMIDDWMLYIAGQHLHSQLAHKYSITHWLPAKIIALLCPTVEYASTVWSSHLAALSNPSEMVPRWAARYIMSRFGTFDSVTDMLRELSWHSDKTRVTMCFRITKDPGQSVRPKPEKEECQGHNKMFYQISASKDFYKYTIFPTVMPSCNSPTACSSCFITGGLQN